MSQLTDTFSAIANAIRSKLGVSTRYKPSQMAAAINGMETSANMFCSSSFSDSDNAVSVILVTTPDQSTSLLNVSGTKKLPTACKIEVYLEAFASNFDISVNVEGRNTHNYRTAGFNKVYYVDSPLGSVILDGYTVKTMN